MTVFLHICIYAIGILGVVPAVLTAQKSLPPRDNPAERALYEHMLLADPNTGIIPANIRRRELAFSAQLPTREQYSAYKTSAPSIQIAPWTHRGPSHIGGRTRAFAIDKSNENNLFAGGVNGGIWRSIDGGQSWVRTTAAEQLANATCIAQDTRAGKTATWYCGTGEYYGNTANISGDGILKSTDNGLTWQPLASTVSGTPQQLDPFDYIWRLATDPSQPNKDVVYAAVLGAICRSENGGTDWGVALGTVENISARSLITDVVVTPNGVVYATLSSQAVGSGTSTVRGIYRSSDGIQWANITPSALPTQNRRIIPAFAPSNENIVYFLAEASSPTLLKYTYVSGDGTGTGGQWDNLSTSIPQSTDFIHGFNSQAAYSMAIKVSPADPNIVSIAGTNIYLSTDGFTSSHNISWIGGYNPDYDFSFEEWINQLYPNHHPDIHDIAFLPSNPTVLFTAGDGGIHKTTNCFAPTVAWQSLNNGYLTTQFYTLAINQAQSGNQTVIGGMQDNHTYGSPAPNAEWKWLAGGDGSYCAVPADNSALLVSAQYGYLCRTVVDNAFTVDSVESLRVANGTENFLFVAPFVLDLNSTFYMASRNRIWRNTRILHDDYATAWQMLSQVSGTISSVAASTQPMGKVYYGTNTGGVYRIDNAAAAPPFTVRNITGSSLDSFPFGTVSCIAIDPTNADNIMVVFSNYGIPSLFFSDNGGTTWANISGNLEENPDGTGAGPSCRWAEIAHTASGPIYLVGTSTGLYSTTSLQGNNTTWVQEGSTSIGNAVVSMVRARQSDGFVAVATHGNGIFTSSVHASTDVSESNAPTMAYLEQNYPNPCSGKTTVRFAVPQTTTVHLTLYDALGAVVKTPVHGTIAAGYHNTTIDTKSLANGRYYLHVQVGAYTHTRIVTVQH